MFCPGRGIILILTLLLGLSPDSVRHGVFKRMDQVSSLAPPPTLQPHCWMKMCRNLQGFGHLLFVAMAVWWLCFHGFPFCPSLVHNLMHFWALRLRIHQSASGWEPYLKTTPWFFRKSSESASKKVEKDFICQSRSAMISRMKESGFFLGWQVTTFIPVQASDMVKLSYWHSLAHLWLLWQHLVGVASCRWHTLVGW